MRDNSAGMPEILDAYERDGLFFGTIKVEISGIPAVFEFGLDPPGYTALKKVLQHRPFNNMSGTRHRYFFTGSHSIGWEPIVFYVRVEDGLNGKQFEHQGPKSLVSNLLWFKRLKSLEETAHLQRIS